jgi:5-methyltetrahydrofolate--homocysteine methyltransferase
MARNEQLYQAVYKGNQTLAEEAVLKALEDGEDVGQLLDESLIPAMKQIGDDFECGEAFVPEMLLAARTMSKVLAYIKPLLGQSGVEPKGKICIGTVKGDLHDIGKNLVAMMLEGAGYDVEDLGVDCTHEKFEEAVGRGAMFVMLSSLLTTTMPVMKDIVEYLKPKYPEVQILIGGAPISQEYSDSIGADGYGATASQAVTLVNGLVA